MDEEKGLQGKNAAATTANKCWPPVVKWRHLILILLGLCASVALVLYSYELQRASALTFGTLLFGGQKSAFTGVEKNNDPSVDITEPEQDSPWTDEDVETAGMTQFNSATPDVPILAPSSNLQQNMIIPEIEGDTSNTKTGSLPAATTEQKKIQVRYILYRSIGNDLPPRHAAGQSYMVWYARTVR